MPEIAVIVYSTYGGLAELAKAEAAGAEEAGAAVHILESVRVCAEDLARYDGYLFGLPSHFGSYPFAFKSLFDGAKHMNLKGKSIGFFVSTTTPGGGQDSVIRDALVVAGQHHVNFVPVGYAATLAQISTVGEVHGGSALGAGTIATEGRRGGPTKLELHLARIQGKTFVRALTDRASVIEPRESVFEYTGIARSASCATLGRSLSATRLPRMLEPNPIPTFAPSARDSASLLSFKSCASHDTRVSDELNTDSRDASTSVPTSAPSSAPSSAPTSQEGTNAPVSLKHSLPDPTLEQAEPAGQADLAADNVQSQGAAAQAGERAEFQISHEKPPAKRHRDNCACM